MGPSPDGSGSLAPFLPARLGFGAACVRQRRGLRGAGPRAPPPVPWVPGPARRPEGALSVGGACGVTGAGPAALSQSEAPLAGGGRFPPTPAGRGGDALVQVPAVARRYRRQGTGGRRPRAPGPRGWGRRCGRCRRGVRARDAGERVRASPGEARLRVGDAESTKSVHRVGTAQPVA